MNASQPNAAGIPRDMNGLGGGLFSGCAVDGAVDAAPACSADYFLNGFRGLKHHVGANVPSHLAAVRQRLVALARSEPARASGSTSPLTASVP